MMSNILQIALFIVLLLLPATLLALILRLPSINQFAQRNPRSRATLVLGNGLLCLVITYLLLVWLAVVLFYAIAEFYFDTTFGLVAGITPSTVSQHKWAAITEMWLRQILPASQSQVCFNGRTTVCQLADAAGEIGSVDSLGWLLIAITLVPTLLNLVLSWRFTQPAHISKAG